MSAKDTLLTIGEELGLALEPLEVALDTPESFASFMYELGWDISGYIEPVRNLGPLIETVLNFFADNGVDPLKAKEAIGKLTQLFSAIKALASISNADLPITVDANEFKSKFPQQLVDYLVVDHLLNRRPIIGHVLQALGVIRIRDIAANGKRLAYRSYEIAWADLADVLKNPVAIFRNAYHWGASDFDGTTLLTTIYNLGLGSGFTVGFETVTEAEANYLRQGALSGAVNTLHNAIVRWRFIDSPYTDPPIDMGIGLVILPETPASKPGFALVPYLKGGKGIMSPLAKDLIIAFEAPFSFAGGVALHARPNENPKLEVGFLGGTAAGALELSAGITYANSEGEKLILLGASEGSRLEMQSASLYGGSRIETGSSPTAYIELTIKKGALIIKPASGEADGFLEKTLPLDLSLDFGFSLGLDAARGFYFKGSGGLEIMLPVHKSLGPLEIESAIIVIKPRDEVIPIELTATIRANLGPLRSVIENIGMIAELKIPPTGGQLGPFDFSLSFRPPNGVGLSVDAGVVKGGGYLYFDSEKEEYAGALELVFQDFLTLKAIGLITTRMPDGSKGFSLLIIITAEFETGIQLGFGFKLTGVGGLLGLNRAMRLQPLIDGVRTGAVNSILFPQDVVANAPRIISDLRTIFPPEQGKFLIGPMAKLAWGTPTLITLSLGIIIEIPGNIAIVGVLHAILPTQEAPTLVLRVNFAGAIEFDRKRIYFFAAIFDSRLIYYTIDGEMGVLVAFGDDANFVLTVGGFHPSFRPPPLPFPGPARISISILNNSNARIRVMGYFAVTSNTAQFGAHAELFFGFDSFSVEGHIGFDVLIQFSPFYLIAEVSASVALKVFGAGVFSIRLQFSLEGPTPWRARGSGYIKLLFFEISADFDITWGEERDTTLPPIAVIPLLKGEFEKAENWRALLPESNNLLVALRKLEGIGETLVLHPTGTLHISQKAVPLDLTVDKVGNQKPSDAKHFKLTVSSVGLVRSGDILEQFAIPQFQEMDDARKLSSPAYQRVHGGIKVSVTGRELNSSKVVRRKVSYEQVIIDTNYKREVKHFTVFVGSLFNHFLNGASISKSLLSIHYQKQMVPFKDKIKVKEEGFTVAFQSNNKALNSQATFPSQAMANEYMNQAIAEDPNQAAMLHVIPEYEAFP